MTLQSLLLQLKYILTQIQKKQKTKKMNKQKKIDYMRIKPTFYNNMAKLI